MPELGKLRPSLLQRLVYRKLGAERQEVLIGPRFGVDNAVVRVAKGLVMIITTDPLSVIPSLGLQDSAWLSLHLLASDITTSGFPPQYAILDLNLPPHMTNEEFRLYWNAIHEESRRLGMMIVGGHTGRFQGCDYTIVGGASFITFGPEGAYLSSNMALVGDSLIVTKGAAIATTGILSRVFPYTLEKELGRSLLKSAKGFFRKISTVQEALAMTSLGVREKGVSAMHDATEGGVIGALYEMLVASHVGADIEANAIPVSDETRHICDFFGIDPYVSLSEGTLVASISKEKTDEALHHLTRLGITAAIVGKVTDRSHGMRMKKANKETSLRYPEKDPYWEAYWKAVKRGWN